MLKNKAVDGLSIGYRAAKRTENNLITDIDLMEISVVTFPACVDAKVESVKSGVEPEKNDEKSAQKPDDTDKQIDAFAEVVKSVSKLTQTIYTLLK
jgi:phage head maturation protease